MKNKGRGKERYVILRYWLLNAPAWKSLPVGARALYVEIARPKEVHITGYDLDGHEVQIEADELQARLFQHELDHLDGVLMFDRMTPEQRKEAMTEWRRLQSEPAPREKRRLRLL